MSKLSISKIKKEKAWTTHPWCVVQWIKNRVPLDDVILDFKISKEAYKDGTDYFVPEWTIEGDIAITGDFLTLDYAKIQEILHCLSVKTIMARLSESDDSILVDNVANSTNLRYTIKGIRIYVRSNIRSKAICFYCLGAYNNNKHAPIPVH